MSHALRFGVEGHASKWVLFNGSLTVPTANGYIPSYFESGFTTRTIAETGVTETAGRSITFLWQDRSAIQDATLYAGCFSKRTICGKIYGATGNSAYG